MSDLQASPVSRILWCCSFVAAIGLSTLLGGCRSSSTNVTGPSSSKCAITLTGSTQISVSGGTSSISVSTNRECTWTAASQASWIVVSPTSGQGPATLSVTAQANTDVLVRRAAIAVNEARIELEQAAAPCSYAIAPDTTSVPASGGQLSFAVTTSATCAWTPSSAVSWITVQGGGSGTGSGTFTVTVATNGGVARTGTLSVAGVTVQVLQAGSAACLYSVTASPSAFGASGGTGTLAIVTSQPGCSWTASANVPWIVLDANVSGTGPASVPFSVQPNSGGTRAGALGVAGESASITQAGTSACTYGVTPSSRTVAASGGSDVFDIDTAAGCSWTAVSNTPWLTITSGPSGTGAGRVAFSAAANTGSARTGTLGIAGTVVTVTQSGCSYTVAPGSFSFPQEGGTASASVTTTAGCAWTAASPVPWVRITAGATGAGSGVVSIAVDPASGLTARTATLTVAGQDVRVDQAANTCAYDLSTTSFSANAAGGTGSVSVTAAATCPWTASSNDAWLSITSGASGSGNGTVAFSIAANTGAARIGTLTIAGRTFTVTQAAPVQACTYAIQPTSASIGASASTISVTLTTQAGCPWTASSGAPWLSVSGVASGAGSATVTINAEANPTTLVRTSTVSIGGQALTVDQAAAPCSYSVAPTTLTPTSAGGPFPVNITTTAGCAWAAAVGQGFPWITISSGANGTGSGVVSLSIAPNTETQARTGTVTVAGQTVTVTQGAAACSYAVAPSSIAVPNANPASFDVQVTTGGGCAWVASVPNAADSWITLTPPTSGVGSGRVSFVVAANTTNTARTGRLLVAGQLVEISQPRP